MSAEELEIWQTDLNAVGCWAGPVDGRLGPQTQAAVEAFQAAKGLEVDGILGPQTEGALEEAVEAGETVCASSVDSNEAGDRSLASLSSASYEKDFALGTCSSSGESDIELAAESDNITLTVSANMADFTEAGGAGALRVEGGTESDGITLNGTVESVSVGDAGDFTVRGVFGPPNHDGEEFNLTGSCG